MAGFFRVQEVDHIPPADGTARPFVTCGGAPRNRRRPDRPAYEESRLVCEAHDECQGDIQSRDVAIVKAADLPTKAGAPNRDRLVRHHVRARAQTVSSTGFDCYSKVLSVVPLGSHLADHHRRMPGRERVSLHNHRWAWFAVVPCSRDSHNVAAPHRSSNSATASIHFSASSSRDRSSAATCRATRRRTVLDRASGTTKRSSFKPRARRRSRMAFIRSAACTI